MFTSMVIAGGANKVLCAIGCIRYLEEKGFMKNILNFVGTSAGALLCFMLSLGYTSKEMEGTFMTIIGDDSISQFDVEQVFMVFETLGLNTGDSIIKAGHHFLKHKTGLDDITFMDIAKTMGKHLVICGSNLTDEKEEYFSVDTHPNMSVITALRISCSIPILFTPLMWNDKLYVDGSLFNNFPISYFKDHKLKDIIGVNVLNKNYQKTGTFLEYIMFLLNALYNRTYQTASMNDHANNIVTIEMEDDEWFSLHTMKVNITQEKMDQWIQVGYALAKGIFALQ